MPVKIWPKREENLQTAFIKQANKMRAARLKRGLSQSDMARLVGTSQPTYSRIESGFIQKPDEEILKRIAESLKIRIDDLFLRENLEELPPQMRQTASEPEDIHERLRVLKQLLDDGIITQDQFNEKRKELLARL
jgi:transcriptional regulator with XRE-family HTH domain